MDDELKQIALDDIDFDNERNCRIQILPISVVELAESILRDGLLQPIVVTPKNENGMHIVVMGYRRCHAQKRLVRDGHEQFSMIKAIINHEAGHDEAKFKALNLTENLHRENLNMLEEAMAIAWFRKEGYSRADTAIAIQMSEGWVQIRYMLLDLPEEIQYEAALGWLKEPIIRQLHTIFRSRGKLAVFEACKKAKVARENGEKVRLIKERKDPLRKRKASEPEMRKMRDFIYDNLGPRTLDSDDREGTCWIYSQMATRALAWAVGDISDYDMFSTLKAYADKTGYEIEMPSLEDSAG